MTHSSLVVLSFRRVDNGMNTAVGQVPKLISKGVTMNYSKGIY